MSIPNPPSPSASQPGQPTRRDRMANALRTLMTNDAIDPEILRAGTEWMTALDVERTQTLTPQAMFPAPDLPADGPYLDAMPIDPALRNQSPFPLDTVSGTSSASSESWLGDVYNASSSPSNNVQADPMSCDPFTLGRALSTRGHETRSINLTCPCCRLCMDLQRMGRFAELGRDGSKQQQHRPYRADSSAEDSSAEPRGSANGSAIRQRNLDATTTALADILGRQSTVPRPRDELLSTSAVKAPARALHNRETIPSGTLGAV
jgi:hypothetical protein